MFQNKFEVNVFENGDVILEARAC